jgi:hypothetical protein
MKFENKMSLFFAVRSTQFRPRNQVAPKRLNGYNFSKWNLERIHKSNAQIPNFLNIQDLSPEYGQLSICHFQVMI